MPPLFNGRDLSRRGAAAAFAVLVALGSALYAAGVADNPPGFFIDESSIAYNAHLVAGTGRDEHGEPWPLYFRAFGDYKNPVYVYLLAAVFALAGPSVIAARLLSASAGVLAAAALAALGARLSGRRVVPPLVAMTALLTPWLFELSRVVIEVAMYPLAVALFLLAVRRATGGDRWRWTDSLLVAASLALLTYTYSVGRLLAPLLALGLALFARRGRARPVLLTWALYALSLAPLAVFNLRHPGALTGRFRLITYIKPQTTYAEAAAEFVRHFAWNLNPWRLLVTGDPNQDQIASIYNTGLLLGATFVLAVAGACVAAVRARRGDGWWLFVLYGLAASVVPASLTNDHTHMLRLAALPVFAVVLTAPALEWLLDDGRARRWALAAAVALTLAQGAHFQWLYRLHEQAPRRAHLFDRDYPTEILPAALSAAGGRRVYLADALPIPGYIQAFWHATLRGLPVSTFERLPPDAPAPEGSAVITTEDVRPRCRALAEDEPYTVCLMEGAPRAPAPLPAEGFRASLSVAAAPARLRTGERAEVLVVLRNESAATWRARERGGSPLQVHVGNHWLGSDGRAVVNDDGRGPLPRDLAPGDEAEVRLTVNAPKRPGDYLLEIDVLQEGVSWFGPKGSPTLRLPVKVVARGWLD